MRIVALLIGLALSTFMGTAYRHNAIDNQAIMAARKTAAEIRTIQKAAGLYYNDEGFWPGSVDDLKNAGYLPSFFSGNNPWGKPYQIAANGDSVTVSSSIPHSLHPVMESVLPNFSSNGDAMSSRAMAPGHESIYARNLHRSGATTYRTMLDDLLMNSHRVRGVGNAVYGSDGMPRGQGDARFRTTSGWDRNEWMFVPRINAQKFVTPYWAVDSGLRSKAPDQIPPGFYFKPGGGSRFYQLVVNDVWYPHLGKWLSQIYCERHWGCDTQHEMRFPPGWPRWW